MNPTNLNVNTAKPTALFASTVMTQTKEKLAKILISNAFDAGVKTMTKCVMEAQVKTFPIGKRRWCIECAARIVKEIQANKKKAGL